MSNEWLKVRELEREEELKLDCDNTADILASMNKYNKDSLVTPERAYSMDVSDGIDIHNTKLGKDSKGYERAIHRASNEYLNEVNYNFYREYPEINNQHDRDLVKLIFDFLKRQ